MPTHFNFEFLGKATRRDFWFNQLAIFGLIFASILVLGLVAFAGGRLGALFGMAAFFLTVVACVVSSYAVGARRCRDLGHSGWMVLLYFVPFVSLLFYFYLGFAPSKPQA